MNRIFNVIWSTTREKWVVVSEKVKSNGGVPKSSLLSIALLTSLLATGVPAYAIDSGALPAGGQITAGAGSIGSSGSRMTVNQGSQQMIANWSSFNIGTDASVQFIQPNVSATVLNRIADQNPSQILGSLSANGKVFLLNQSGIIFGKNARVDVGGLVASSLNMLDSDFLAAKYKFFTSGNAGKILNQGSIIVAPGGVVALIAPKVTNEGAITAKSGSAALGAGNKVSVDFTGDGLITLTVDQGVIDALVENKGLVKADGGLVVMTASAADALSQSTVNNSGIIEANTLQQQGGRILLDAVGGMTTVSGTLDAFSADGKGGQVVATGDRVLVTDGAHLTASGATGGGEVLVGGNWQGKDTAIHQATGTIVEPGALLEANATDTGNGGTVVAWSDVTNPLSVTRAYGTFEAMGGPHGGDGGRIETSGHWLDVAGSQGGASAAHGQGGLWLFDPYDVTISDTFFVDLPADSWSIGNPGDPLFWIPVLGSNISVYSILGKLSGGTHVTVETSGSVSAGGEPGIIDVRTDIILASTSPLTATLTLKADSSIQLHNFTIGCIDSARLNLELVTLGTVSGTGNIGGWGDTIFNIGGNSIYDGTISDGSSLNGGLVVRTLTKEGTGTLTLTAKNNFTGTTTINAGAIMVSGTNAALGDTSGGGAAITVVSGAALELDNVSIDNNLDLQGTLSSVSGDNTYGGYISLFGLPTINADSGTTLTVDFAVYGFGDLSVSGQGTVVFNGEIGNSDSSLSSFTGATETTLEIYGGLVETVGPQTFNGPTTFGNVGGTKLITSIGGITAHGQVTSTAALTLNAGTGDIAFDNSSNDFSTLEVTSAGDITLIDKNALTLSGILATGTVYVETLTDDLTVDGDINNGNFSIGNDVFVTLRANQNIILKQSITNTSSFKLNLEFKAVNGGVWGTGNIIGDGATIFNVGGKGIYDGTISNGVSTNGFIVRTFTKDGSGEQTLLGSNTYTGDTTVSTGTLILGASDVIPNLSNLVVDGSGVFDIGTYNDTVSTVTLNGTGSIIGSGGKLASSSYTIDSNGDTSISAILSDFAVGTSSTLDKYKTGTLTLSGANTYTGVTTINGGTISIAADSGLGAVPTAPVTGQLVLDNGTLETTGSFTLSSNRGIYLTMGSGTFSTADGTTLACDGIIAGSGGLTKIGAGTLTLSGLNTYDGVTTIKNGALNITNAGALGSTSGNTIVELDAALELYSSTALTIAAELLSLSGTGISGGGALRNRAGTNNYSGNITLTANSSINSDPGTGILTVGAIDGPYNLVINSAAGVTLTGKVGNITPLVSLSTFLGTKLYLNGSLVTTTGTQTYNDAVTLGGDTSLSGTTVTFNGTVDGGTYSLYIAGNAVFGDASVDTVTGLNMLHVSGTTLINSSTVSSSGVQTYNDGVTLGSDVTLTSTGVGSLGDITFDWTLDGGHSLAVNTAGATTFGGIIGGTAPLTSLTTNATGTTAINGSSVTTAVAQTYNDAVTFGGDTSLIGPTITFNGIVAGGTYSLDITGNAVFGDASGDIVTGLNMLQVSGTTLIKSSAVSSFGVQRYNGGVTLGSDVTLTSTGVGSLGDITFDSTLDGGQSLTVNSAGTTTFGGAVGLTTAQTSLTTDAGGTTVLGGGSVKTTGTQTYGDAVTLGAPTTLASAGVGALGDITFDSTLDGGHSLAVNTAGATTFGGIIGGTAPLTSLTTNATGTTAINGSSVTTTGSQTYNDAVTLGGDTSLSGTTVTFNGTVDGGTYSLDIAGNAVFGDASVDTVTGLSTLGVSGTTLINSSAVSSFGVQRYNGGVTLGSDVTLTSTGVGSLGDITFDSTLDGGHSLAVNTAGVTTFGGIIGGVTPLTSLTTDAPGTTAINGSSVTTAVAQTYNDAVTFGGDTSLIGPTITFNGIVAGGTYSLDITGNAVFGDASGDTVTGLSTLGVSGTTLINSSAVSSFGVQRYNGGVTLGSDVTLTSTGVGSLGDITFDSTLDGGQSLTVNTAGATTFGGIIGGTAPLTSLTTNATGTTAINGSSVTTTGSQTYNDAVTFGGDTSLIGPTITFNGIVAGGTYILDITGNAVFGDASGDTVTGLSTLGVSGTTLINSSAVSSFGVQRYNDGVILGSDVTLTSTGVGALGDITFDSTLDGGQSLTVNSAGTTTFGGAVGLTTALTSLTTDAGGTTVLGGGSVKTTGTQTYGDAVTLGAPTTLASAGVGALGDITFDVALDGGYSLTVNTAGTTTFDGAVGGTTRLTSLTRDAGGTTVLGGGSVKTTGTQTYGDAVTLGAATTLESAGVGALGDITFGWTLDGGHSLTVNTAGTTTFGGIVGGMTPLLSLDTSGLDPVLYGSVSTIGAQIYHDIVTLGSDIILTGKNITFDSTVKSVVTTTRITNFSLTVVDSGSTILNGAVGGDGTVAGEKLSSLTISSVGDAALNGIQATGPISVVTSTGNLIVDGNISTLDTSAKAIQLNAGQDLAAGTATGGNIIIKSGAISVGTGGIATLYTGSVSNSTGLTNLVGIGSGRFRYNSDETATNYVPSLAPLTTGLNAIYRESPSVEVALANETIQSIAGVQNNDPVTNIAGLIALGYSNLTVTLIIVPDVHVIAKVDESLSNTLYKSDEDGNKVVIYEVTANEKTSNEVAGNETTGNNEVTTPPASDVTSVIGPAAHVAVGSLALASPINTFNGRNPNTAAVPNIHTAGISGGVPGAVNNNEADKYADLLQKLLMTGGAIIILGSGSLLLGKKYTTSKTAFGKHANVYAHLDHGYQHLNSDVLPKDLDRKREVSVRIHLDMGIQELQVSGGSLVNSD